MMMTAEEEVSVDAAGSNIEGNEGRGSTSAFLYMKNSLKNCKNHPKLLLEGF
jgi:hypothetical protein